MRTIIHILIILILSLPVHAADWGVRAHNVNVMINPSSRSIKIYTLNRGQYIEIKDVERKGGWIKIRFSGYVPAKDYGYLRRKGAEIKEIGREGSVVQATITGWAIKAELYRK